MSMVMVEDHGQDLLSPPKVPGTALQGVAGAAGILKASQEIQVGARLSTGVGGWHKRGENKARQRWVVPRNIVFGRGWFYMSQLFLLSTPLPLPLPLSNAITVTVLFLVTLMTFI